MGRRFKNPTEERVTQLEKLWFRRPNHLRHRPFLRSHSSSARGFRMRAWSIKAGQIVHLQRAIEFSALLSAEFNRDIVGLREQVPLKREVTRCIAKRLELAHPRYHNTKIDKVLTTTFLMRLKAKGRAAKEEAWSVDYFKRIDPQNPSTEGRRSELKIMSEYWNNRGVGWRCITERDLNPVLLANVEWMSPAIAMPEFESTKGQLLKASAAFLKHWYEDRSLGNIARAMSADLGLTRQTCVARVYQSIWLRILDVDIENEVLSELRPVVLRESQADCK